jgi:hypothetical protein
VLFAIGAVLGSLSTDIIGGKPVSTWSVEARVARDIKVVDGDLRQLQRADALLVLDLTTARARLDEIASMRAEMQDLAAAASGTTGASDETTSAFRAVAKSADAAAQALDGKIQLTQQYDTRIESEVELLRDTVIAEALRAAQYSRQAASIVGVEFGVQE